MRGHQARLSPTSEQAASLHQWTGAARFLWNLALEQRTTCRRRGINKIVQCRDLTELRAEVDWILDLPAQVAQQVLADLDLAYQRWGVGLAHRPGRKRRFRNEASLRFPQGVEVRRLNRAGSRGTAGARQELTRTCSPRRCAPPAGEVLYLSRPRLGAQGLPGA
jgi:putative transposase